MQRFTSWICSHEEKGQLDPVEIKQLFDNVEKENKAKESLTFESIDQNTKQVIGQIVEFQARFDKIEAMVNKE